MNAIDFTVKVDCAAESRSRPSAAWLLPERACRWSSCLAMMLAIPWSPHHRAQSLSGEESALQQGLHVAAPIGDQ